jgi:hypothetical protein
VSPRALTGNAADPRHVDFAGRKERRREELFRQALGLVLSTPEGRVVLWTLLERAGVFRSVWDPSAKIHYNAGRQDYGHELLALLVDTNEESYLLMEREARQRARRDTREAAAVQAPAAD